jgi:hypothetical protein
MAGRHAADRDPRGGERIPPARARARSRLALALAALAIAAGVAVYGTLEADRLALLVLALGAGSVALLAFGLAVPSPPALVGSFMGIAASWSLSAWTRGSGAPGGTILAAAGIFVAAELAYWSLEQASVPDEPELLARRAAGLALRAVGAVVLVSFALAALGLNAGGGLVLEAVGAAAAVALLALVLLLARAGHETAER